MIITLTTDFGLSDPYAGVMKGVMLSIAPDAQLVDLTHDVRSYDILEAAFLLEHAYRYFPEGTVHLVVVDPGVGSARRPLAASARHHMFVGPDNGVLSFALYPEPKSPVPSAHHITNVSLFLNPVSRTFHGRDIFAPVAAHLARGMAIESVGPRVSDFIRLPFPTPRPYRRDSVIANVVRVDKFGNVITNLRRENLQGSFCIEIAGFKVTDLFSNYAEAKAGELFAIEGSTGYIEIALNQGSAANKLDIHSGVEIAVHCLETGKLPS
jgi:S-adenosylmethionine hydrolase